MDALAGTPISRLAPLTLSRNLRSQPHVFSRNGMVEWWNTGIAEYWNSGILGRAVSPLTAAGARDCAHCACRLGTASKKRVKSRRNPVGSFFTLSLRPVSGSRQPSGKATLSFALGRYRHTSHFSHYSHTSHTSKLLAVRPLSKPYPLAPNP